MFDLRQALTGAWIRTVADIRDAGEVLLGFVSDPDGGSVTTIASDRSDVYVKVLDALHNAPIIGRLFAPLNILWRLPLKDDSVVVLRGADTHGPGAPIVMHGDGGANNQVPPWLDASNSGFYLPEGFHIESTKDQVIVKSNSGGTSATMTLGKDGKISLQDAVGLKITTDASSTITVDATGVPSGTISLNANPVTGAIKLGPVGSLAVLVQGSVDSLGVPVQQNPAAALTIVKAG